MRLMAGVAGQASGVIGTDDLRESFGLGAIGFVAAGADDGGIELRRLDGCGIVGVPGLGAMTGFAGDHDMSAEFLLIDNVGMAGFADVVPGVTDGAGGSFCDGVSAVVPILSKTMGHDGGAQQDEGDQRDHHHSGQTNQVFRVFEQVMSPGVR